MDNITEVRIGKVLEDSRYMKPKRLCYKQGGKEKIWGKTKLNLIERKFYQSLFRPC